MFAKQQQTQRSLANHLTEVNQLFDRRGFVVLPETSLEAQVPVFLSLQSQDEKLIETFQVGYFPLQKAEKYLQAVR